MSDSDLRSYHDLLKTDYYAFLARCFAEFAGGSEMYPGGHISVIASRLEEFHSGKLRRLIINVPPRHLKSFICSVTYPAWVLGYNPHASIICASYSQDLADKFARDCLAILQSPFYKELFPNTRLASANPSIHEIITTAGGFRLATSVGGVLTGRGANLIIIDDPLKASDALSDSKREGVNDWFDTSVLGRLDDKRNGQILLLMQRLHERDLTGHVLTQSNWDLVRFAAIAEANEEHHYSTPWGPRVFTRREGEVLQPEREPLEILEDYRRGLGTYNFSAQYQQSPTPPGGGLIKIDWFRRYEPDQLPKCFDRIVQSWDTANKVSERTDYSVCTTWAIKREKLFLLHVLRKRLEYPDLKRAVKEQQQLYSASVVLIEDHASGTQLIQELIREGMHTVTRYIPSGDKVMRMHAQTALIENGFVYLPTNAHWLDDYLRELPAFYQGPYDDQVDSTSQFLDWYKRPMTDWAVYELYRQQSAAAYAEKMNAPSLPCGRHVHTEPFFGVASSMTATTIAMLRSRLGGP